MTKLNGVDFSKLPKPVIPSRPDWLELYDFSWKKAAQNIRISRGRRHMDAAWNPAVNYQWVWDTCFMVLYCRYGNGQYPGVESLDNFYEMQRADGYIGMTYDMTTGEEPWPNRINPPLFAWVEWEHYCATGDSSRFSRVIPHIEKLMEWIDANRRTEPHRRLAAYDYPEEGRGESDHSYQLYYFEDCGSSGMDDSPRTPRNPEAGRFFDWIDLSSQMVLSSRLLSRMHAMEGNTAKAKEWQEIAKKTGDLVNSELWCQSTRFYHDRSHPSNFVSCKTAAGFWPILAGICPQNRLEDLVAHLENREEFNRTIPVPTLSADDANFSHEGVYWLGGVWAPTNYMITRGLQCAGRGEVAHEIAVKYLNGMAWTYSQFSPHTIWECYSSEAFTPGKAAYTSKWVKPDFVGWSGIGPIAMLIENIIGIELNAPEKRIDWTIRLTEEHGLRQLAIPGGHVDLICEHRKDADAPANVSVSATAPVRISIRCNGRSVMPDIIPGKPCKITV
jgi:glycogen debranching enzyme